jgi:glycosyltransferase involved in cell wall biosynthesis
MTADVGILFYPRYEISYSTHSEVLASSSKAQQIRTVPFALSFNKLGCHLYSVLSSLGYQTTYHSIYETFETQTKNFIVTKNLVTSAVSNQMIYWDNALRNVLSLTSNKIFYGVIEGPISNPPSNCTIIVPSKYVAYECEMADLKYDGIIPHGFDPLQFSADRIHNLQSNNLQESQQSKTTFYCLAKYSKRKGFERLFEAVRKVKNELGENKFVVYVRTSYPPHFKKLLEGLDDVVKINDSLSKLPDSVITSEMSQSDCYVVSSLAEGFCLPALEAAFGCGKPVIYPNTSPYTDYLDEEIGYPVSINDEKIVEVHSPEHPMITHFRFKYWDIDEFAKSMIRVIENPKEMKLKGDIAFSRRKDWTIYNKYKRFQEYIKT